MILPKDLPRGILDSLETYKKGEKFDVFPAKFFINGNYYGTVKGWQVHHKLPLDDGGTNEMDNLILIENDPYHKVITNEQNALTKGLLPGQTKTIKWPIPEGSIFPAEY